MSTHSSFEITLKMDVPPWVHHMVAINNYHQQCNVHEGSHTTCQFFCITCLSDEALCIRCCKDQNNTHDGHDILQLRRSSRMTVIKVTDIEDIVDIGAIQNVMCNQSHVVYVKKFESINIWKNTAYKLCRVCRHKLERRHVNDPLFCSIQCMLEYYRKKRHQRRNNQRRGGEAQHPSPVIHQQQEDKNQNIRNHKAPRFDRFQMRKPDDQRDHNNLRNPMNQNRQLLPQQEQLEPVDGRSKRTYRRKQPYPRRASMGNIC